MLTADLVRVRRKGRDLVVRSLSNDERAAGLELATELISAVSSRVGASRAEIGEAVGVATRAHRERKIADGLAKLLDDACKWGEHSSVDAAELRREIFTRASAERRGGGHVDRAVLFGEVARGRGDSAEALESALYSDLRAAHLLEGVEALTPTALVERYEAAAPRAVLLRAVRVVADVTCSSPDAYRALFRTLKFRRLLHRIERRGEGYRITIDGPYSMFESVTKYGLSLSLSLSALEACDTLALEANVRWGKQRDELVFRYAARRASADATPSQPPDDIAELLAAFERSEGPWRAELASELLDLPGLGIIVPDVIFRRAKDGAKVHFELLGHWSRDAVWKRVELAEAGLPEPVLFAASERLRVSEEVLDRSECAALYVFKGTLSARAIARKLDELVARS